MMSAVTLWMVRAGQHGEGEHAALNDHLVGIGWPELGDLTRVGSAGNLGLRLDEAYPDAKPSARACWAGQIGAFCFGIQFGDLVALPLRSAPAVAVGRVTGEYRYAPDAVAAVRHQRPVQWIAEDIPRDRLDQDLLFALGARVSVGEIGRGDAELRVEKLLAGPAAATVAEPDAAGRDVAASDLAVDLGKVGRDQIRRRLGQRYRGHELGRLVGELLRAEGFVCDVSPPGPDGAVNILAGPGGLGFGGATMAVHVPPGSTAGASALRELRRIMRNSGAERGLLVSWGGFNRAVRQETRRVFFEIRLWDSDAVVGKLQEVYDRLPADVRAEIPLQRVWVLLPGAD
jgi:restriction system protein